jgi:hypothetical protein
MSSAGKVKSSAAEDGDARQRQLSHEQVEASLAGTDLGVSGEPLPEGDALAPRGDAARTLLLRSGVARSR